MAIPSTIAEVIRLANIQNNEENKLEDLRNKKIETQAQVTALSDQIAAQVPVVQAARIALKAAALLI